MSHHNNPEGLSCQAIIDLINNMVDEEIEPGKLALAKKIVENNPQCCALYHTLLQTIDLYRRQNLEMTDAHPPKIQWDEIMKKLDEADCG